MSSSFQENKPKVTSWSSSHAHYCAEVMHAPVAADPNVLGKTHLILIKCTLNYVVATGRLQGAKRVQGDTIEDFLRGW